MNFNTLTLENGIYLVRSELDFFAWVWKMLLPDMYLE